MLYIHIYIVWVATYQQSSLNELSTELWNLISKLCSAIGLIYEELHG